MITVYITKNCPSCIKALQYLEKMNIPYDYVDVNQDSKAYMKLSKHKLKHVPQLFIGEQVIWGGIETLKTMKPDEIKNLENLLGK